MATNKQRREAERLRLQRQLEERRKREASRRTATLVASIIGTLVVIALVVGLVFLIASGGDDDKKKAADKAGNAKQPAQQSSSAAQCGQQQFPAEKVKAATGKSVKFQGVTVKGAADLTGKPGVTSKASAAPKGLETKDLVVGKGKAASPTSCVTVQYDGVLYKNGKEFDSSWKRGMKAQFPLTGVVPGFTQGIGGTKAVQPMREGGRRIIVLPPALGYGAQGSPPAIPANAPLVFIVDLVKVTAG